ncbi:hypothetical protein B0H15DRAFT_801176 [Mycena belliarum]|uniref:Uncharacterized protein n=1 Tax=Mycena belliarum TaxID=1033014 RepID=A0AAD6XQM2_9AGAR|nr:hypothetical protein B0H15DRAFT_801176 [Mycena belliae]
MSDLESTHTCATENAPPSVWYDDDDARASLRHRLAARATAIFIVVLDAFGTVVSMLDQIIQSGQSSMSAALAMAIAQARQKRWVILFFVFLLLATLSTIVTIAVWQHLRGPADWLGTTGGSSEHNSGAAAEW